MAIGCYTPTYLPASFQGITFSAFDVTSEHGRNTAEGEFPFGEDTAAVNMGRKIRRFTIAGKMMDNDHVLRAARLIAAVEQPGTGVLVHPTRGVLTVVCTSLKITDNPLESNGVTEFTADFVEANDWLTSGSVLSAVASFAVGVLASIVAPRFTLAYTPTSLPFFAQDAATEPAREVATFLAERIEAAMGAKWGVGTQAVWSAANELREIATTDRAKEADSVWLAITAGSAALASLVDGTTGFETFRAVANRAATIPVRSEPAAATVTAARTIAAGYMATFAASIVDETPAEILRRMTQVVAVLDDEIATARAICDNLALDALYAAIDDVQKTALAKIYSVPAVVSFNFIHAVPSLVAAYEIWNDSKRRNEIERNNPNYWPWQVGPHIVASKVS